MKFYSRTILKAAVVIAATLPMMALAQVDLPAPSPKASATQMVGVATVTIEYSSPGVKGRTIWGDLVPYDKMWRVGANAVTQLTLSHDATIAGKPVKAGKYAVYITPSKKSWKVNINTGITNWGTRGYDAKADVAAFEIKPAKAPARERMTFIFSNTTDNTTRLDLEWAGLRGSFDIGFEAKAQALAGMEKYASDARGSLARMARYYTDHAGEHDKAIAMADASLAIEKTWFGYWIKAQAQANKGDKTAAHGNAQKAWDLGMKKPERFFYKDRVAKALKEWK